jgi:outer membrane receptor protein involved in Fe transport
MPRNHHCLTALAAALAALGTADALAQAVASPYALDNVVVTATRAGTELKDLAGNTEVLGRDAIDFALPQRPAELINRVPGLNIQQGSGEEHLTAIRSPVLNGGAGAGSFLYLEDGVPLRAAGWGNVNGLYEANAEQAGSIEVVRGPGSALYGSNAVHGLINFIPRDPAKSFEAMVDTSLGQYGLLRAGGTISDTIGATGLRFSAQEAHEQGWRQGTELNEQKMVGRSRWTGAQDSVETTLSGQYLDQRVGAYLTGTNAYQNRKASEANANQRAYRNAESIRLMSRWRHDLGDTTQLSVTPYVRYTEMDFMMHFTPQTPIQTNAHGSVGTQAAIYQTVGSRSSVILGLDSEYTSGWYKEIQTLPTLVQGTSTYSTGTHYDFAVDSTVFAPYLHSEWQILDHTRLVAGARGELTHYDYTNNAPSNTVGLYQRQASRSDDFATFTPKLGLVQDWAPWLASYVNLSRGARAPQITDVYALQSRQVAGQIKTESLDSLEIGLRGRIESVTFDLAVYDMRKKNYFYRSSNGLNVTNGRTEHRGLELGVASPLPLGFDVGASGSLALHTYGYSYLDTSAGATGIIASVHKGGLMPEAPRNQANLRLGYTAWEGARAELEWIHMGRYTTDNAGTHSYGGHEVFNLRLSAKIDETLSLHGKVLNLFDRAYADRAAVSVVGVDQYFPGAPRTVMGGVTLKF